MRRSPARFLVAALLGTGLTLTSCMPSGPARPTPARDAGCRVTRVVDGDTVDMTCPGAGRFRARLTGFDTAESHEPGCPAEAAMAARATTRLRDMVRGAGTLDARDIDRYGRRLVHLRLDGVDVADTLVGAGLAVRYAGGRRIDWCARLG